MQNTGWFIDRRFSENHAFEVQRTFVILGRTRGGTSFASRVLFDFGLIHGEDINKQNLEYKHFNELLREKRVDLMVEWIKRKNKRHDVWAIKSPKMFEFLNSLLEVVRYPHFIFVARDPVAVTVRANLAGSSQADAANVESVLAYYQRVALFLQKVKAPVFYVSYEKALLHPQSVVEGLAKFCGIESRQRIDEAISNVKGDNPIYLGIG